MARKEEVIAFDVIETMFGLEPVEQRLNARGLPSGTLKPFFGALLRDAFALDAVGTPKPFRDVAQATLEVVMASHGQPDKASVDTVLQAFTELRATGTSLTEVVAKLL